MTCNRKWLLAVVICAWFRAEARGFDLAAELARAKPAAVVSLPAGTFAAGIEVPPGVTLRGAGYRKTTLEARGAAVAVALTGRGARLEDLAVRSAGTGVGITSAEDAAVRRVMIVGGAVGIRAQRVAATTIENTIVSGSLVGISLNEAARSTVANCTIATADACGLSVSASTDTALFNNLVVDAGTGVVVGGANRRLWLDYNLYLALAAGKIEGQLQRPTLPTWRDVSGGLDAHSVQLDVKFADPARCDFHPVSTLRWNPARATTAGWGVAELAGHKAPTLDMDGRPRGGPPGLGALETPDRAGPAADGRFTIAADDGLKSAGLFTPDDRLVCYLFQGLPLRQGTHDFVLPASDLFGRPIPPGPYQLRLVESAADWVYRGMVLNAGIDNTPAGADSVHVTRLAYNRDGRLLTASGWSERHINLRLGDPATGKPAWVLEGSDESTGLCLDGDGKVLLVRNAGDKTFRLTRIDPATGIPLAWPGGALSVDIRGKFKSHWLGGIAELDGKLFVADTEADLVFIDAAGGLKFDTSIRVAKPVSIVADRKRKCVWLISNEKIVALDAGGRTVRQWTDVRDPLAVSVAGDRLAVASGATGKIHIFDIRDAGRPALLRTLGRGDGPFGRWLPDRFHFQSHPLNTNHANVALALGDDGSVAVRDASGRLVTFGPDGRPLHDGVAQWGNDPLIVRFAGDRMLRVFDTSGCVSYFIDPASGRWEPDTYWGLPPMTQPAVQGFFSAGGRNFGVFKCRNPQQGGEEWVLIANFDQPVVRAVALYKRNPAGGCLLCKDTNHDGRIDDRDAPGRPVLDTDGKPVLEALSGRFMFVSPDGTIVHSGHPIVLRWKLKGLDAEGVPIYEFGKDRILTAKDPLVPSPYFAGKTEDLRCASAAKLAADGSVWAGVNLRHTPNGMGLSNSGATDLARWNPDGSLRWLRTVNDYDPIQGVEPLPGVLVSSWGHQAEFMALGDDGLELGRFGFPAAVNWSGYWVDHPQQWAAARTGDGRIEIVIGDYTANCHHWMTLRGTATVRKSRLAVSIDAAKAKQLASRPAALHEPLGRARAPEIVIKRLPGPLAVDGDLSKWRRLGFPPQVLLTPQNSFGKIDGPADCSGVVRLGYHGRDLYAAVIVFDNVVSFHQPAARFYKADSLQFCINGFLSGFGFSVAQTTDKGAIFFRNRFFFQKMDLDLDPLKAPRIIRKFASARDIPERQYIESIYGVDLSPSPGYVIEFKLPLDESTYRGDEKIVPPVQSGKWFWLGFMLNDNDTPGTDVQNFIAWPASFGIFNPPESGARAFFE
ncbi:MAG: NosD domain-containing protein [Thermoguttaceae bacterium]